jgi:hypothetical protein
LALKLDIHLISLVINISTTHILDSYFFRFLQLAKVAKMANPRCFFDLTADGKPLGRVVMELRADVNIIIIFLNTIGY